MVEMASFVTEVLAHSGRLEKEDLCTRISRLTQRVEEIKVKAGQPWADCKGTEGGVGPSAATVGANSQVWELSGRNEKWEGWEVCVLGREL